MGLFSNREKPFDARSFGTWNWYGDEACWHLSLNNQLSRKIGVRIMDFVFSIQELHHSQHFPENPTDGKRIMISGMQGFGDDYRWYATVHGMDGRHYFFQKTDASLSAIKRIKFTPRQEDEIDKIPFQAEGDIPNSSTHRRDALVTEDDPQGRSQAPTLTLAETDFLAPFADLSSSSYDELCFYLFGGTEPWQEAVVKELKRRHQSETLKSEELNLAIKRYNESVEQKNAWMTRQLVSAIEARLRQAQGYGFDPPGGWGAIGPG
jgi:hypothetical protein